MRQLSRVDLTGGTLAQSLAAGTRDDRIWQDIIKSLGAILRLLSLRRG
jgi:hypothetical protein